MRRKLLQQLATFTGLAAVVLAVLAMGSSGAPTPGEPGPGATTQMHGHTMPMHGHGEVYREPTPNTPSEQDYMQENSDGTWSSRLLPYAKPYSTREALEKALAEARRQGVIR